MLDVGGSSAATFYSFLNRLRISGNDANTIWQTSTDQPSICSATSSTSAYIYHSIGNGSIKTTTGAGGFGINTGFNVNPRCALEVNGIANIHNGSLYAVSNNFMSAGSLTIGGTNVNYGGGSTGWTSSTAGLMMECSDYTEIAVHDSLTRITSLMYYDGVYNKIYIGRNKGWGVTQIEISGNFTMPCDKWIYSGDALRTRLYNATNGTTYHMGYGDTPHLFWNGPSSVALTIYNSCNVRCEGEFSSKLYCISGSYRDLMGVYAEGTPEGSFGYYTYYIVEGTFTGFHRVFTEDELFNKEDPQALKDAYEGRIVIS